MVKKNFDKETTLGQKIKQLRKDKSLTQERLAIQANVSYTTLTKVENGAIKNPSFEIVASLAKALEISLDDLTVNKHD
jgi:transcriptional regulator with XRE-family HTH domain